MRLTYKENNPMTTTELYTKDIHTFLDQHERKEMLRFVAVGSVDDGKSTLIGRLLYDTGQVYADQLEDARKNTAGDDIDFSLLTDGLNAEREQGITIDVAYRYFATAKRKFIIADTPGHVQYTRNMVTGASTANAALILIDARLGVLQQSKRHAYIASMLGIPHLIVCVNKMDLVDFDKKIFDEIKAETLSFTEKLRFKDVNFFPISALKGDNVVNKSEHTPWFDGGTILEFLEDVPIVTDRNFKNFRFPVQYVLRPHLDYRAFAGQVSSGVVKKGDPVQVLPSGKTSKIKAIDVFEGELDEAFTPMSVAIRLEDEIDVSRGDMLCHPDDAPHATRHFQAQLVWMSEQPLDLRRSFLIKHTSHIVRANVKKVHSKIDPDTLDSIETKTFALNEIGSVSITTHRPLFFDDYQKNRETGAFILIDSMTNATLAAGMITGPEDSSKLSSSERARLHRSKIKAEERQARLKQRGGTIWFAGLPHGGQAALAYALEKRLFDDGYLPQVLDAEDFMQDLDADVTDNFVWAPTSLGVFSRVARRGNATGLMTICTLPISRPQQRETIRSLMGDQAFFEIHLDTPLAACQQRLQEEGGEDLEQDLNELTFFASSYTPPTAANLSLSHSLSVEEAVDAVVNALREHGWLE